MRHWNSPLLNGLIVITLQDHGALGGVPGDDLNHFRASAL
jgi:hypothetical protein